MVIQDKKLTTSYELAGRNIDRATNCHSLEMEAVPPVEPQKVFECAHCGIEIGLNNSGHWIGNSSGLCPNGKIHEPKGVACCTYTHHLYSGRECGGWVIRERCVTCGRKPKAGSTRPEMPPSGEVKIDFYRNKLAHLRSQVNFIENNFPELAASVQQEPLFTLEDAQRRNRGLVNAIRSDDSVLVELVEYFHNIGREVISHRLKNYVLLMEKAIIHDELIPPAAPRTQQEPLSAQEIWNRLPDIMIEDEGEVAFIQRVLDLLKSQPAAPHAQVDDWRKLSVTAIAAENPSVAEYVDQLETAAAAPRTQPVPKCPKCKCISINIRNTHVDDLPEHTTGECYRSGCRYKKGPIARFFTVPTK